MADESEPSQQAFWSRADEVIALANQQKQSTTVGQVSGSLMYAAARFNAFNVANRANDAEHMKRDRDAAIEYFTGEYRKMLIENLDDYIENFDEYAPRS